MKKSITHSTSFFIDIVAFITPNAAQSSYSANALKYV